MEEEEEPPKIPTASKSKRRKEIGVQNHDKVPQVVGRHPLAINQALSFLRVSLAGAVRGLWGPRQSRQAAEPTGGQGGAAEEAPPRLPHYNDVSPSALWLGVLSLALGS